MTSEKFFPCHVQQDNVRGRHLIAAVDIRQGSLIFTERPLMVGPCGIGIEKSLSFSTCLGCYKNVTTFYKCSKCGWPVCNPQCEAMPDHANYECMVFAECPVSPITNPPEYEKIKILRCLMLKEKNPERWNLLMGLESHAEVRKQNFYAVSSNHSFFKFIKQECMMNFSFEEIHHAAGVCAVNSYGTSGLLGHGNSDGHSRYASFLFYNASLVSHDCLPNTRSVIQQKGKSYVINIIATRDIHKGEPITCSYIHSNVGTLERREQLLENFYFSCECKRCRDPSEMGSNFSAVKCTSHGCNGFLLPTCPTDSNSEWMCSEKDCNVPVCSVQISNLFLDVKNQIRQASELEDFRLLLEKFKGKLLHPNNYFIINLECTMIRLIDKIIPEKDDNDTLQLAKWQIELCRHCMSVADLIQPGGNQFRGNVLYYLQEALLTHCTTKIKMCSDSKSLEILRKSCKKQFVEALEIMKEAKAILLLEPVGTSDWQRGMSLSIETPKIKSLMTYLSFKD